METVCAWTVANYHAVVCETKIFVLCVLLVLWNKNICRDQDLFGTVLCEAISSHVVA